MKIVLDTQDVKDAIRAHVESTGFVDSNTPLTMDITKLRKGDGLTVEVTIGSDGKDSTDNEQIISGEESEETVVTSEEVTPEDTDNDNEESNPFVD